MFHVSPSVVPRVAALHLDDPTPGERLASQKRMQHDAHRQDATIAQGQPAPPRRSPKRLGRLKRRASLLAAAFLGIALVGGAVALLLGQRPSNLAMLSSRGTIYALASDGSVSAVDARSGRTIWRTPLPLRSESIRSSELVITRETVFVTAIGDGFTLYALQASRGQLRWKRSGTDPDMAAPLLYPADDGSALYLSMPTGISAWRASDGQLLWSATCRSPSATCRPEIAGVNDGVVYAYLDGLTALKATAGSQLWRNAAVHDDTPLVVTRTQIYVASYGGGPMRVLQATTGLPLQTPGLPRMKAFEMIARGTVVYVRGGTFDSSEDIYAVRQSDNTIIWHRQYNSVLFSGASDGSLYTFTETVAVPGSGGQPSAPPSMNANPGSAFVFSHLCALSDADGAIQWCRQFDDPRPINLLLDNARLEVQLVDRLSPFLAVTDRGTVYVLTGDAKVEAVRLSDGAVLWAALRNVLQARVALV